MVSWCADVRTKVDGCLNEHFEQNEEGKKGEKNKAKPKRKKEKRNQKQKEKE